MKFYRQIADLSLDIEEYNFNIVQSDTSSGFTRATTVISLHGNGETGYGEDVATDPTVHQTLVEENPDFPLRDAFTHHEFSTAIDSIDLYHGHVPPHEIFRNYRRWAFESAALDLALKQNDTNLAALLGYEYNPIRFVVSTRLGEPSTFDRIETLLQYNPDLEFKLDPTPDWSDRLINQLTDSGRVQILDLKGNAPRTSLAQPANPDLYQRIIDAFPDSILEDPVFTDETRPLFTGHEDRVSWDAQITGVESVESVPFQPEFLNIKPQRFGSVESLLDTIEYCKQNSIRPYGGGQFELDVGRKYLHELASLFYPEAPNDVAPRIYNKSEIAGDLPRSPLSPPTDSPGLN
jgi:hypothetical protein